MGVRRALIQPGGPVVRDRLCGRGAGRGGSGADTDTASCPGAALGIAAIAGGGWPDREIRRCQRHAARQVPRRRRVRHPGQSVVRGDRLGMDLIPDA